MRGAECADRRTTGQQLVDLDQVTVGRRQLAGRQRGLGELQHRGQRLRVLLAQYLPALLGLLALLGAVLIANLLPRLLPACEACLQQRVECGIRQRLELGPALGQARRLALQHGHALVECGTQAEAAGQFALQRRAGCLRRRLVDDGLHRGAGGGEQLAILRAGSRCSAGRLQVRQHLARLRSPALEPGRLVGTLARRVCHLRHQRGVLGALFGLEQLAVQCGPGAVDIHQPVQRDQRFQRQRPRLVDQPGGAGAGLALRHGLRIALLGQPMGATIVVAQLALGHLQRRLGDQRGDGSQLYLERRRLAHESQQCRIVSAGGLQPVRPVARIGVGSGRRQQRRRSRRQRASGES